MAMSSLLRRHHARLDLPSAMRDHLNVHAPLNVARSCRSRSFCAAAVRPQPRTAGHQRSSHTSCRASQQQQAAADAEEDATQRESSSAQPSSPASSSNSSRARLMTTAEEIEGLEALESVQDSEVLLEDRGEAVFLMLGAAIAFGAGVWGMLGPDKGAEYFAGYLLEQSLSVDNLFVFILVFKYFQVPQEDQSKVLSYGLVSAAVLRAIMILAGVELIQNFRPILLVFAGILVLSSYKLLTAGDEDEDEDLTDNFIVKTCRRFIPVTDAYDGDNFFTIVDGQRMATPLLLVLAVIELSDVVFAVDSVPAVFGVTLDPFIVYSSNIFAILSLRSLYSFVATVLSELRFLNKAVAIVLGFVGLKMTAEFMDLHINTQLSLAIVAAVLSAGVGLSLLLPSAAEED